MPFTEFDFNTLFSENVDHATEIVTNTKVLPNLVNLLRPNIYNTELMLNTGKLALPNLELIAMIL
jgi:hypothetical protein